MLVFQVNAQKPLEQQQLSTKIFTGKDAQRILQGLAGVSEPILSKVFNSKPDTF